MHTGGEQVAGKEWLARCMRSYYTDMYNYGTRFTRDEQMVKEGIQEIFINLWQNRHTAGRVDNLKFYFLRAVKNKMLTSMERCCRGQNTIANKSSYPFLHEFSIDKIIVTRQIPAENSEQLQYILDSFTCSEKEVVYLKYYQHIDNEQIAALMNVSRQYVYNMLLTCLLKLSTCLQNNITLPR